MRKTKGQVLVETAIILPLLLLLIFGLFDYARAMYTKNSLTNAARSGARTASVTSGLSAETAVPLNSGSLSATGKAVKSSLYSGIPDSSVKYDLAVLDPATLTPVAGTASPGNVVRVTVTYSDFSMITPFYRIAAIVTNSSAPSSSTLNLTGEASMRYE